MSSTIHKAKNHALTLCENTQWDYKSHIESVAYYSRMLAKEVHADSEVCETAAWLHDIAKIKGLKENHHLKGADIAEEFLKEMGSGEEFIKKVKGCIITHSRSSKHTPISTEEKVVASADALSHFDNIVPLAQHALVIKKKSAEETRIWMLEKYEKSFEKMSIAYAREIAHEKYICIKKVLQKQK